MKEFVSAKIEKLLELFPVVSHLSRKKFVISFLLSMISKGSVQCSKLAQQLNSAVQTRSNERRIQSFFKEAVLDEQEVAHLLSVFLPFGKVDLCLDRTEWDFGLCQVNILCLSVYCQGIGIPLYIELLDNQSGNSNTAQRIDLLEKAIGLLGKSRITSVIADREFIGQQWIEYLLANGIGLFLRLPKSARFQVNGVERQATELLQTRNSCRLDNINVYGITGLSVAMEKITDEKTKTTDYLIVITNRMSYQAIRTYKRRWSIEVMFKKFKTDGFNLEATHIRQLFKLKKLLLLVCIAFALCLHTGFYCNHHLKKIPLKKHGYKQYSFFRVGLDYLQEILFKTDQLKWKRWHDLTDQFIHLAYIKMLTTK